MKNLLVSALAGFAALAIPFVAGAQATPDPMARTEHVIGVNSVYIPSGFGPESPVHVIVNAQLPSGCYKYERAEVTNPSGNIYEVRVIVSVNQSMCTMAIIPIMKEVSLGQLGVGEHRVRFMRGDGTYLQKVVKIER